MCKIQISLPFSCKWTGFSVESILLAKLTGIRSVEMKVLKSVTRYIDFRISVKSIWSEKWLELKFFSKSILVFLVGVMYHSFIVT